MSTEEEIKTLEDEKSTSDQAAKRVAREARQKERAEKKALKDTEPQKDTTTLEKEIKKLQRELKREQRASKSADQFEREMKAQKEELDAIINSHMIYVQTDKDLIIKEASRAFGDQFGYSSDMSTGESFKMLIQHDDIEKFYHGCEYVASHGKEAWGTGIKMLTISNDTLHTHTFIYPTFVAGTLDGFTFVIQDISSQILLHKFQRKVIQNEKFHRSTLDFISSTSAAVLDTVSYKVSAVVKIIVSFMLLFLIYAVSFNIDEISRGSGQFIPTAKVKHLKNLEGGIISSIYVQSGDSIKKGQILLRLNPLAHQSKLEENKIRLLELEAKKIRLKAELSDLPMDSVDCDNGCDRKFIELEENYYLSNQRELTQNISKQMEQLKYQKSVLIDSINKFNVLEENYNMLNEEFNTKKELAKRKIFTKYEIRTLERELNDLLGNKKSAKEVINQTKSQIQEIKNGIEETKLTFKNKASLQYSETIAEILRLEETKKSLEDIINRTVIRSPVDGIVKELFVNTIGTSVEPSAEILTVVPKAYEMIAEVKMKPEEIAKLHIGQSVKLKVTAFDYSIYGDLEGKITNISPDTIIDKETGDSHYLIYIKTKRNYLNNNEKYKIKVGMMVNADILVGKKSIMSFLLKPILKTTQRD